MLLSFAKRNTFTLIDRSSPTNLPELEITFVLINSAQFANNILFFEDTNFSNIGYADSRDTLNSHASYGKLEINCLRVMDGVYSTNVSVSNSDLTKALGNLASYLFGLTLNKVTEATDFTAIRASRHKYAPSVNPVSNNSFNSAACFNCKVFFAKPFLMSLLRLSLPSFKSLNSKRKKFLIKNQPITRSSGKLARDLSFLVSSKKPLNYKSTSLKKNVLKLSMFNKFLNLDRRVKNYSFNINFTLKQSLATTHRFSLASLLQNKSLTSYPRVNLLLAVEVNNLIDRQPPEQNISLRTSYIKEVYFVKKVIKSSYSNINVGLTLKAFLSSCLSFSTLFAANTRHDLLHTRLNSKIILYFIKPGVVCLNKFNLPLKLKKPSFVKFTLSDKLPIKFIVEKGVRFVKPVFYYGSGYALRYFLLKELLALCFELFYDTLTANSQQKACGYIISYCRSCLTNNSLLNDNFLHKNIIRIMLLRPITSDLSVASFVEQFIKCENLALKVRSSLKTNDFAQIDVTSQRKLNSLNPFFFFEAPATNIRSNSNIIKRFFNANASMVSVRSQHQYGNYISADTFVMSSFKLKADLTRAKVSNKIRAPKLINYVYNSFSPVYFMKFQKGFRDRALQRGLKYRYASFCFYYVVSFFENLCKARI